MGFRIGWFSTGRDEAAGEILAKVQAAIYRGHIPAKIAYVFSNRTRGEDNGSDAFFRLVGNLGMGLYTVSSRRFAPELFKKGKDDPEMMKKWRIAFDLKIEEQIGREAVDLIVLAGYMLIVGSELCTRYPMINLHPAAPEGPVGTWQEVIWSLIRQKATRTGIMMHQVTEALDKGPPITYCTFPIRGGAFDPLWKLLEMRAGEVGLQRVIEEEGESNALFSSIRSEGVAREIPLVIETLKVLAEGRVRISPEGPADREGKLIRAFCLNEEIEKAITGDLK